MSMIGDQTKELLDIQKLVYEDKTLYFSIKTMVLESLNEKSFPSDRVISVETTWVQNSIVLIVFLIAIDLNWPELTPKPS